jgi:hypothetical protein
VQDAPYTFYSEGHPSGHCDCLTVRREGDAIVHYRRIWFWQVRTYLSARWTVSYGVMFGGWYALNPAEWLFRLWGRIRPEAFGDFPLCGNVERKISADCRNREIHDANIEPALRPSALAREEFNLRHGQSEVHLSVPIRFRAHDVSTCRIGLNRNAFSKARSTPAAIDHRNAPLLGTARELNNAFATWCLVKFGARDSHLLSLPRNRVLPHQQERRRNRSEARDCGPIHPIEIHRINPLLPSARA